MSPRKRKLRKQRIILVKDPEDYLETIWARMTDLNLKMDKKRKRDYVV
jgi:hypothetical protein